MEQKKQILVIGSMNDIDAAAKVFHNTDYNPVPIHGKLEDFRYTDHPSNLVERLPSLMDENDATIILQGYEYCFPIPGNGKPLIYWSFLHDINTGHSQPGYENLSLAIYGTRGQTEFMKDTEKLLGIKKTINECDIKGCCGL